MSRLAGCLIATGTYLTHYSYNRRFTKELVINRKVENITHSHNEGGLVDVNIERFVTDMAKNKYKYNMPVWVTFSF